MQGILAGPSAFIRSPFPAIDKKEIIDVLYPTTADRIEIKCPSTYNLVSFSMLSVLSYIIQTKPDLGTGLTGKEVVRATYKDAVISFHKQPGDRLINTFSVNVVAVGWAI